MIKVLPRDAFNDANLLKCIGKLTLAIENRFVSGITYEYDGKPFDIRQRDEDGSTFVCNIEFYDIKTGRLLSHSRPLNSREAYSLFFIIDGKEYPVFTDCGNVIQYSNIFSLMLHELKSKEAWMLGYCDPETGGYNAELYELRKVISKAEGINIRDEII